ETPGLFEYRSQWFRLHSGKALRLTPRECPPQALPPPHLGDSFLPDVTCMASVFRRDLAKGGPKRLPGINHYLSNSYNWLPPLLRLKCRVFWSRPAALWPQDGATQFSTSDWNRFCFD